MVQYSLAYARRPAGIAVNQCSHKVLQKDIIQYSNTSSDTTYTNISKSSFLDKSANDHSLNASLIPRSLRQECPDDSQYRERFGVCTCNEHCSWDLCRSLVPPKNCLAGTGSVWLWDHLKYAWVAQIDKGNNFHFKTR